MAAFFPMLSILAAAATFSIQLLARSRLGALAPFAAMMIGFFLLTAKKGKERTAERDNFTIIDIIVASYALFVSIKVILKIFWAFPFSDVASDVVNFVLPVFFYWYFRQVARIDDVRDSLLVALVFAGAYSGLFFVYDSFCRVVFNEIPGFSKAAFQYSLNAMNVTAENMNATRIVPTARAMGIMVSHSSSATWIALGSFAAFSLFKGRHFIPIFLITMTILVIGLNYTGIVAYLAVTFLCYNESIFDNTRGKPSINRRVFFRKAVFSVLIASAILVLYLYNLELSEHVKIRVENRALADRIMISILEQTKFIFSEGVSVEYSYLDLTMANIRNYFGIVSDDIGLFLFGTIPAKTSKWLIGGDTGFLDSVNFLGFPVWLCLIVLISIAYLRLGPYRVISPSTPGNVDENGKMRFFVSVILLMVIMDFHYNVWLNKSLQIVLFAAIGYAFTKNTPSRD